MLCAKIRLNVVNLFSLCDFYLKKKTMWKVYDTNADGQQTKVQVS